METRFSKKLRALGDRLLNGPGRVDGARRRAAAAGSPLGDPALDAYLSKIHTSAYTLTERSIADLRADGWSEDEIFELSVCASYGAARMRMEAALRAVEVARTPAAKEV